MPKEEKCIVCKEGFSFKKPSVPLSDEQKQKFLGINRGIPHYAHVDCHSCI